MIWFTSDLHLGHEAVIRFCNRPYSDVSEMDADLIRRYCAVVKPDDTVYFLGDISFHRPLPGLVLLRNLPGKKILVRGNHDKYSDTQYERVGFSVYEELRVRLSGSYFTLSHYPYEPRDKTGLDPHDLRYLDRRPVDRGGWLLCGHVHEKWKTQGRMINVGVDVWKYAPVSLSSIQKVVSLNGR